MTIVNRSTRLINTVTKAYPVFLQELNTKIPNACFPDEIDSEGLESFDYVPVALVERPVGDVVTELPPVLVEGVWTQAWDVRNYTPEEAAPILAASKESLLYEIEALRLAQFRIGFPHLFGENGDLYHVQVRDTDRVNILSYRTLAKEAIAEGNQAFEVEYRVYENVSVHLNAEEVIEMANTSATQVLAGYKVIWELKLATTNATTLAELPALPESIFSL